MYCFVFIVLISLNPLVNSGLGYLIYQRLNPPAAATTVSRRVTVPAILPDTRKAFHFGQSLAAKNAAISRYPGPAEKWPFQAIRLV